MHGTTTCAALLVLAFLAACSSAGTEAANAPATGLDSGAVATVDSSAPGDGDAASAVEDAAMGDAGTGVVAEGGDAGDAGGEGGDPNACEWGGAPGDCMTVAACTALTGHSSYAGQCPGPATIECCIVTPSTTLNPPIPAGYQLMQQAQVTSAMTTWAVAILNDPATYPMFATTTMTFGSQLVLARVEWHPPDFQNSVVHRGVTLYVPV